VRRGGGGAQLGCLEARTMAAQRESVSGAEAATGRPASHAPQGYPGASEGTPLCASSVDFTPLRRSPPAPRQHTRARSAPIRRLVLLLTLHLVPRARRRRVHKHLSEGRFHGQWPRPPASSATAPTTRTPCETRHAQGGLATACLAGGQGGQRDLAQVPNVLRLQLHHEAVPGRLMLHALERHNMNCCYRLDGHCESLERTSRSTDGGRARSPTAVARRDGPQTGRTTPPCRPRNGAF